MFMEVSAKTAYNVEEAFSFSAKQVLDTIKVNNNKENSGGIILDKPNNKKKEECKC